MQSNYQIATFASGCFWCTEAVFQRLKGVSSVKSGYSGGQVENPGYSQVSKETTGHAEAIQVKFDPTIITYKILLDVFWSTHDPTQLNRQGNDVGTQYRSVIFYHNDKQKKLAEESKKELENKGIYKDRIATEIVAFKNFYPAEDYHQNFYNKNKTDPYCRVIIDPKLNKLRARFHKYLAD